MAELRVSRKIGNRNDFFEGFPSLADYARQTRLKVFSRFKLGLLTNLMMLYKLVFARLLRGRRRMEDELSSELVKHRGHTLRARGAPAEHSDGYYLNEEQIKEFEKRGILGPFDVIPPEQARDIARFVYEKQDSGAFAETSIFDEQTVSILQDSGQWGLDYSGLYQALRYRELWDVLAAPPIADRMASLLGNDVTCWRSQFFEKKPGSIGTFWHQNSVFRETGDNDKLTAPEHVDPGMIQLTAWVALTDVTRENGAMRIIPGSFVDSSTEFFYSYIQDNILPYLGSLSKKEVRHLLQMIFYSTGSFFKAQAVFDSIYDRLDNGFDGMEMVDLEMKAGQAVIFSSLNMHASYPNETTDQTRLAIAGRYCNNDVKVFNNMTHGVLTTAGGPRKYDIRNLAQMQIHGEDRWGHNNIVPYGTLFRS